VARRKRKNPWVSASEIIIWLLFALLLIPVGFAGYAVGHYTSIGKPPTTVTITVGGPDQTNTTPTTTSAATTTTSATTTGSVGGAVAAGTTVFASSSCGSCHTFAPAGASGTIGPNLDTAPAMDAKADGNMSLAAFIKQSIIDPNAYIAKGYTKPSAMPGNFGTSLTSTQINNLVAFILSGTKR
jgi:cytochrome c551/c552